MEIPLFCPLPCTSPSLSPHVPTLPTRFLFHWILPVQSRAPPRLRSAASTLEGKYAHCLRESPNKAHSKAKQKGPVGARGIKFPFPFQSRPSNSLTSKGVRTKGWPLPPAFREQKNILAKALPVWAHRCLRLWKPVPSTMV